MITARTEYMCSIQRVIAMLRHPENTNLHLHYEATYAGMPVMEGKGPFVVEYLEKLRSTLEFALIEYPRVFAFRVDLRLPAHDLIPRESHTNALVERFLASFKAKINHNRDVARRVYGYAHGCRVRYVWAREVASSGRPHYHLVIFLNQDAFYTVGKINSENENIRNRLDGAWASALGVPVGMVSGLVEIPENAVYRIGRNDLGSQQALFYRASYLCKAATKHYGDSQHGFGASRI